MKKLFITLMTTVILFSCEDFKGQFQSQSAISLKDGKKIPIGLYNAEVKIKGQKKIKLKLKNSQLDETITIKLDQKLEDSMVGGIIDIPAGSNDQDLQLSGSIKTDISQSGIISGVESCTLAVPIRKCKQVCSERKQPVKVQRGKDGKRKPSRAKPRKVCKKVCNTRTVLVGGSQAVEYHYTTKTKVLDLAVYSAVGNMIGDFSGSNSDSEKSYNFVGHCSRY